MAARLLTITSAGLVPPPQPRDPAGAFTESVPHYFCSCKALAILYIVGSQGLSSAWPCPSSLKVDFRSAFEWVFAEQHAFGIFATDATGLSGTADDAAL
jgi:hypothetical protein